MREIPLSFAGQLNISGDRSNGRAMASKGLQAGRAEAQGLRGMRHSGQCHRTRRGRDVPSQSRLLTLHSAFYQLSVSLGGGFVGAFLLKIGFSLTQALLFYAALLT